jgi:serine/threonine protein kinase
MSGEKDSGEDQPSAKPRTDTWESADPAATTAADKSAPLTRALRPNAGGALPKAVHVGPPAVQAVLAESSSGPVAIASDSSLDRDAHPPGTRLGGFEILRLIGRGGMGAVYEAVDTQLSRTVALKTLTAGMANREAAVARFKLEAQAAAQLLHPNVVAVHAFGVDRGVAYMAMEYLRGETLSAAVARGPLSAERTADIMLSVCAGVHEAHRAGIVHRDLKPGNIFLAQDWFGERPKVLDFGISKLTGDTSDLTGTGDIIGTSQYLSPEQAAGRRDLDARSDQYSLAVVLYECVTKVTPNAGENLYTLIRNIVEGRHRLVRQLRPELPAEFEAVIERAMSLKPDDRFTSMRQMGAALLPFASDPCKRQWSDHYAAERDPEAAPRPAPAREAALSLSRLERTEADPQAVRTLDHAEPPPADWQQRPTRSAVSEPPAAASIPRASAMPEWVLSGESASIGSVTRQQRRTLRRVLVVAGSAVVVALTALIVGRFVVNRHEPAEPKFEAAPAIPTVAEPPSVPPTVAPAPMPSPAVPSPPATTAPGPDVAGEKTAAPEAGRPSRSDAKPKSKGKRVRYTPDGLPIL